MFAAASSPVALPFRLDVRPLEGGGVIVERDVADRQEGAEVEVAFAAGEVAEAAHVDERDVAPAPRHLGDRPKRAAVAENSLGPRVMRRFVAGPTSVDLRVDVRKIIQRSYVDYTWMNDLNLVVRRQLNNHVTVYGRGYGEFMPTEDVALLQEAASAPVTTRSRGFSS